MSSARRCDTRRGLVRVFAKYTCTHIARAVPTAAARRGQQRERARRTPYYSPHDEAKLETSSCLYACTFPASRERVRVFGDGGGRRDGGGVWGEVR